jgi:hypothetical protein
MTAESSNSYRLDPLAKGHPDHDPASGTEGVRPPSVTAEALLLARIRAAGHAPSPVEDSTLRAAARVAATIDRRPIETGDSLVGERVVVLGWVDGASPDPDRHPSAPPRHLSSVPYLVWAACLARAWPDPAADPYPGRPFRREDILRTCVELGAPHNAVAGALDKILPSAGLLSFVNGRGMLGPAAAALPEDTWSQLRRVHERLPHSGSDEASVQLGADRGQQNTAQRAGRRKISGPPARPHSFSEAAVSSAVAALECAQGPIARADLPMLADPAIRASVSAALTASGRALVDVEGSWTTGYPDAIAVTLADNGWGTLATHERAILALVLLHAVAIPRARGAHEDDRWTTSMHATSLDELAKNRQISKATISEALRGLRNKGYVALASAGGYIPGPALARITPRLRTMLWEDLVILGRPDGYMATRIRQQRERIARPDALPATGQHDEGRP